jgi:hypothetical protein
MQSFVRREDTGKVGKDAAREVAAHQEVREVVIHLVFF